MKKKAAYLGLISLVAAFAVVIYVASKGTGFIKINDPDFKTHLDLHSFWGIKEIPNLGIEPVEIRAGSYKPEKVILKRTDNDGQIWWIICQNGPWGKLDTIKVTKGKTTLLKLGPPLIIHTDLKQNQQTINVSVSLIGQAGEYYSPQVMPPKTSYPNRAKLKLIDEAGNELVVDKLQYGWLSSVCTYSWRVPSNFKGRFQVKVDIDSGPFEVKQDQTWFEVE